MSSTINEAIKTRLETGVNILITSHVRPDGDAVGSLLGMGLALQNAGRNVQMVLTDGVSSSFKHLEGSDKIKTKVEGTFDTFITLDCADFKRTGKPFEKLGQPDINIDHHITNEKFGKLNLIEAQKSRPQPSSPTTCLSGAIRSRNRWQRHCLPASSLIHSASEHPTSHLRHCVRPRP